MNSDLIQMRLHVLLRESTSIDGKVFGKMGHSERAGKNIFKNIIGNKEQKIFENGVKYFK